MSWRVSSDVSEFDEAVAHFRGLVPMTDAEYELLEESAKARAFTIAAHIELHAVQTIYDEIAKAIAGGTPIEEFEKAVASKLDSKVGPSGYLLETVFINANQQSYSTGRYDQMNDPALNVLRPYRMYDSVLDGSTTQHCKDWDGVIRAYDDPCWLDHHPQCHHRCRAQLRSLRESEARERGLTMNLPGAQPASGFGVSPSIRRNEVPSPDPESFDDEAWAEFMTRLSAARVDLEND
jgi:hypothetical protein